MKVFVAGGTGVLGRASLRALVGSRHEVTSTARGADRAKLATALGAKPVEVDLFDAKAVRSAIAGSGAVLRLTTKIPSLMKMRGRKAWDETVRLRTEGARILVDAAIAEHVPVYIHESVTFVYRDGGDRWLDEGASTDDGNSAILHGTLQGEQEALRFTEAGGRGVVLRFGAFYGPEAPSTRDTIRMVQLGRLPQFGSGPNFFSSIYTADAGRAVAAALQVPAGIYNVADDEPIRFYEYLEAVAKAARAREPHHLPGLIGRWVFGATWGYFSRSLRVSNAKLKQASGWKPSVPSAIYGWNLIVSELQHHAEPSYAIAH
jgi:nucleoside-diphosphate-sugar epimerase